MEGTIVIDGRWAVIVILVLALLAFGAVYSLVCAIRKTKEIKKMEEKENEQKKH